MAINPCPTQNRCREIFGAAKTVTDDGPIANLSAEAPDSGQFVSTWFPQYVPDDPISNHEDQWNIPDGGGGFGDSTISQEDADRNAERQASDNSTIPLVGNDPQVCETRCAGGEAFSSSIPANVVFGLTKADANARAVSMCQTQASAVAICFLTSSLPSGCVNSSYNGTIVAVGGTPHAAGYAYFWEITSGAMPPGVSINPITGALFGTPTSGGSYSFTVMVTDGANRSNSKTFTISIIEIVSTDPLASGIKNTFYSNQLVALPVDSSMTWAIASGSLPPGLGLSASGLISGTPTTKGTYAFTVSASLSSKTCTKALSIKIWDSDNTLIGRFGVGGVGTFAWTTVGAGVYIIEFRNPIPGDPLYPAWYGSLFGYANTGYLPDCNTAPTMFHIATAGGVLGDCTNINPVIMRNNGVPIGNIIGYTRNAATILLAQDIVRLDMIAAGTLLRMEFNSGGNVLSVRWDGPIQPPCGVCNYTVDSGGTGMQYRLIRIGQP